MTVTDRYSGYSEGLSFKRPCLVASTSNITLSGSQTIDGVVVVTGNRVLVTGQSTASQNGIYVVSSSGAWSRALDFDGTRDAVRGTQVYVNAGTTYSRTLWAVATADDFTIGTSSISIVQYSGQNGATGATGAAGAGYGGTSATSLLIANSVTKTFTTQAGLAYQVGNYVRASSAANGANYMEGLVSSYSGTTLAIAVTAIGGSGTLADWRFSIAGTPGVGSGVASVATQTGALTMNGGAMSTADIPAPRYDVAQTLTAAQKAQVRANQDVLKKNYIINGAMMVSQENGTTAGTTTGYYPVDMFRVSFSNAGAISTAQVASVTSAGSPNRLRVTVTTADAAVAAGDYAYVRTTVEGLRLADLKFGTASAKQITLQFGVKAPAGTYCVALRNSATNRSYVGEYVVAGGEANTDVVKSVTLTADTSGTWLATTGIGVEIIFGLMCGSTFQQAASSWSTGNVYGSSNQFNLMGTISNVFELFDVSLTDGSVAPAFQVPDYTEALLRCQRHYFKSDIVGGYGTAVLANVYTSGGTVSGSFTFPVRMRATPSGSVFGAWTTNGVSAPTWWNASPDLFVLYTTSVGSYQTAYFYGGGAIADARL